MLGLLNSSIRRGTILGMRPWFSPEDMPAEQTQICLKHRLSMCFVLPKEEQAGRKTVLLSLGNWRLLCLKLRTNG